MGASLALQVVIELEKAGKKPVSLVVSGKSWPITGINHRRYLMPQHDFEEGLKELGGVPSKVLENSQLFNFFSAALRSDLEIVEKKGITNLEYLTIDIPIIALMGDEEEGVDEIMKWQVLSRKKGKTKVLPGNHFFIHAHPRQISDIIRENFQPDP
jgi:surfactin synthase thioesterase subunit